MKKILFLFAFTAVYLGAKAQLVSVTQFNQIIQDLKVFNGNLFIGGNFTQNQGQTCYWSASYNGSTISRHTGLIGGLGVRKFDVFDNELYNVGTMQFGASVGVGLWNGSTWTNGGSTNNSHSTIYADGNTTLYIESDNGLIRSKTPGGSWQTFYDFAGNGGINSIIRYGSNLIFTGSFTEIGGIAANNIALWNGVSWAPLGAGLNGIAGTMCVYNSELYVIGNFTMAGSTTVKNIAKWNGSSWADVGGGLTGASFASSFSDLIVHNGFLYACGRFDIVGGQTADDLAFWNGTSWTGINYPHTELSFSSLEIYNNKLFVAGSDFTVSNLYKYEGGLGITENSMVNLIGVTPNPSNGQYTIQLENASDISYSIYTVTGLLVEEGKGIHIDLTNQAEGSYYVHLSDGNESGFIKLMKTN